MDYPLMYPTPDGFIGDDFNRDYYSYSYGEINQQRVDIYCDVINAGAIPSMLLYIYTAYLLLMHSPAYMAASKWLLLNITSSCFLYDAALFLWKPVVVPGFSNFYYSNSWAKQLPSWMCVVLTATCAIAFSNLMHSLLIYMAYRYKCIISASDDKSRLLSKNSHLVVLGVVTWPLALFSPIAFLLASTESRQEVDKRLKWQVENRRNIDNNERMLHLNASIASLTSNDSRRTIWAPIFAICVVLTCVVFGGIVLTLTVQYYRLVIHGHLTGKLSIRTRQLQLMLYRAQTIQLAFYFVFQIGPGVAVLLIGMHVLPMDDIIHFRNDNLFSLGMAFTSFHSFFDYFAILYFIRPYRYL